MNILLLEVMAAKRWHYEKIMGRMLYVTVTARLLGQRDQ